LKRYILDSGIVTDLINHRNGVDQQAAKAFKRGGRLGTPVLGELLAGLHNSSSRKKNLPRLERTLAHLALWPFDELAARQYGEIAGDLCRRGIVIQQIDMQIAAIAFALGKTIVVSRDGDFREIKGLAVENWAGA
jgi:tRNA(fMet)-specific endonuclease VapC